MGFGSCGPVRDPPEGLDGTETRVGEVYTLYVEPDFQNQGLGRRLLDALFRQLKADGFFAATLVRKEAERKETPKDMAATAAEEEAA